LLPDAVTEICLHVAVIAVLGGLCALLAPKAFRWRWLIVALLLVVVHDALLVRLYGLIPHLIPGSRWNWTGKILATLVILGIAALPRFGWKRSGITIRQAKNSGSAWIVFGALTAVIFIAAVYFGDGRSDWDTILFQWTMPGIQEEVFYRGVLLLALNEAFTARKPVLGAEIGWGGVLATVAFGLIHSLFYGAEGVSFDAIAFAVTGGPALLLLWFREKTGSVVLPIVAHNVANGAFTVF
jgi:uncharacterized protein